MTWLKQSWFKLFLLFLIPIFIWACLFWSKEVEITKLGERLKPVYVSDTQISKPNFKTFLADSIQIPLNLKWYEICFYNETPPGPYWDTNRTKPVSDMRVMFLTGNPNKYTKSNLSRPEFGNGGEEFSIKYNEKGCFNYSGTDGFSYRIMAIIEGAYLETEFKYRITAKPISMTLVPKLIIIYALWMVILQNTFWAIKLIRRKKWFD